MWCKAAGLRQTFQANVKLGFDNAKILADGWAHHMQLVYDRAQEAVSRAVLAPSAQWQSTKSRWTCETY